MQLNQNSKRFWLAQAVEKAAEILTGAQVVVESLPRWLLFGSVVAECRYEMPSSRSGASPRQPFSLGRKKPEILSPLLLGES